MAGNAHEAETQQPKPPRYVVLVCIRPDDPIWTVTVLTHNDLSKVLAAVAALREKGVRAEPFKLVPVAEREEQ